jgi:hypothetical protein
MVDTCPMTEGRYRLLMSIDERLSDDNFPQTIIDTLADSFLKRFDEIGSHRESWRNLVRDTDGPLET